MKYHLIIVADKKEAKRIINWYKSFSDRINRTDRSATCGYSRYYIRTVEEVETGLIRGVALDTVMGVDLVSDYTFNAVLAPCLVAGAARKTHE